MKVRPEGAVQHAGRGRTVAALLSAGLLAVALGGNPLGAAGVTTATAPDSSTPVTAADPVAFDTTGPPPPPDPGSGGPAAPTGSPDPSATDGTTTTPAAPADPAPAPAAEPAPAPAADPAPAPAPDPAPSADPAAAAPQTPAASAPQPAATAAEPQAEPDCITEAQARARAKQPFDLAGSTADRTADRFDLDGSECGASKVSRTTAAPERGLTADPKLETDKAPEKPLRNDEGVPTMANPTTSLAIPGAVPVGVPNFFIDKFRIPVFLLPIYQAAGIEYGVRWEILAAINEIETDYGRNLNISTAGALGWMQFMPATWKAYGTDANKDGRKDPYNPVDAIFAAARYLKAAGADTDLRKAIFAYNHADWYVDSVLMRARLIGGMPSDLVGSLSGLTLGHFPVFAKARYADDIAERRVTRRVAAGKNAAMPVDSDPSRRGIDIFAKAGSPVIAVQDGTIVNVGRSKRLGRFVQLRDVYGNTYTYGHLKKIATRVPVPKARTQSKASIAAELELPKRDPKPTQAASAGTQTKAKDVSAPTLKAASSAVAKERLFAHPARENARAAGGDKQILQSEYALAAGDSLRSYFTGVYGLDRNQVALKSLVPGRRVIAGTILGRIGTTSKRMSPHVRFEIRPAGRGAPRIDPHPILNGWKLLESTAIYRAKGKNALVGPDAPKASIGEILLMSKETLAQRVLANPRIEVYSCGRRDIEAGIVDRRVLATLEFLAASGLEPTVTSLHCGHGYYTSGGRVSVHSSGNAVDIAKINGIPVVGHQGEGSITDITVRRLLTLQGTLKPDQIITLMKYEGVDNTLAMGDHGDHIHVGFVPLLRPGSPDARRLASVLKPSQWIKLIDRLGRIDNPKVSIKPSKYAVLVPVQRHSSAHRGE